MMKGTQHTPRAALTARTITALKPGKWATDVASRGEGVLQARKLASGSVGYYLRTTAKTGQRVRVPLGAGIDFNTAKRKAAELSLRYQSGERDLRAALDSDQRERDRKRKAADEAQRKVDDAEVIQRTRTLGALLTAYADQLQRDGKTSARKVHAALRHTVRDAWPKLWAAPLANVTADHLLAIVAVPAEAGSLRQAEKVRAYLRAAFAAAIKARHNAKALPALRALRITANPAASLTPIEGANRARDRALSLAELRAYWKRVQAPEHGALRFHLLTGCQRIAQLARATVGDYDADTQSLRLLDGKRRRSEPRQHHVPILPDALDAIRAMHEGDAGPYLFTVTGGVSGMEYGSLSVRLRAITDAMLADGELPGGAFTPGDLRRTVEARLADAGVLRDTGAGVQSHGPGGIQARHYDRHDCLPETRAALETLHRLLTDTEAEVVPIRKATA